MWASACCGLEVGVASIMLWGDKMWVWSMWAAARYARMHWIAQIILIKTSFQMHLQSSNCACSYADSDITRFCLLLRVGPYLLNPHEGLQHPLPAAEAATVWGWYAYHHYMQDRFDDNVSVCTERTGG